MRLLWFSHIVPFPPRGGNRQRSFNLIRQASKSWEIFLVAFNLQGYGSKSRRDYADELRKYCEKVEVWELPRPWRGVQWWAEMSLSPLFRAPYTCRAFWSAELAARWEQTFQDWGGALLHFDSPDLALFATGASNFRRVLNHHNCESAMAHRRARVEPNPIKRAYLKSQVQKLARLEEELCHLFEVNVVVSELDGQTLQARNPKAHVHVVENGTDTNYFFPGRSEEEPRSLIFAGSLDWYPNLSGLHFFVREVWPRVRRQCPNVRLYLAGKNPSRSVFHWARNDPNVVVIADPDDIRPWLARAGVFICPILDGGGTRLKILDAMAMGKPVVSTPVGCEGLRVKHGENILVADTSDDFANEVLRVLQNEPLRQNLGAAGRSLVEKAYDWGIIGEQLEEAYRCALDPGTCCRRPARLAVKN